MGRTIDDLLELSRIETSSVYQSDAVALAGIIDEAVSRIRPAAEQAGITIDARGVDRGVEVSGDGRQLTSAISNLLDNAVKYSDAGSTVEVGAELGDEGRVAVSVSDRGIGIPARDLERIFERFYRVDQGRSRQTGGTGLGLAIVRHVAANHHGTVEVESRLGEGSTFTLRIPATATAGVAPSPDTGARPMTSMPSVLVVEDEDSFVDALTVGLTREGFKVSIARDGAEALDLFDDIQPDLVLLDVMLPKVSGLDVCRELRSRSSVPIIMVTAKGAEIDTVVGLEVGADDYVTKPYRLRELVARMRAVLRRHPSEAPPVAVAVAGDDVVSVGDVSLDHQRHEVVIRGEEVRLPLKEFELLAMLLENAGRVLTRDTLIDRVWGADYVGDTKTLDVHVKRLRAKVEPDPAHPSHIVTIRGLGYKYDAPRA